MALYEAPGAMRHGVPAAGARIVARADHTRPVQGPYAVAFTIEAPPSTTQYTVHSTQCTRGAHIIHGGRAC